MKRPKTLDKFLNSSNPELEVLVTHALRLRRLQGQYQQVVGEDLARNCQVANFRGELLTLSCRSAAWATRAKMEKRQLLATLRTTEGFSQLQEIEFITRPISQPIDNKETIFKIPMSVESANSLSQMAESISDPALRAALRRLARHKND